MQKSQWKIDFLTHFPGLLSFYTPLEHTKNFPRGLGGYFRRAWGGYFRVWGGGVGGLYKSLRIYTRASQCFNIYFGTT